MSSPISGFMPIPLAMMLPFMAAQSMLMGDAFGRSFQYGKRKISAMSNEEFNKFDEKALVGEMMKNYHAVIPELKTMIAESKEFQTFIFASLLDMPRDLLSRLFGAVVDPNKEAGKGKPDTEHSFLSPIEQRAHIRHGHRQEIEERYGKIKEPGTQPIPTPQPILIEKVQNLPNILGIGMGGNQLKKKTHKGMKMTKTQFMLWADGKINQNKLVWPKFANYKLMQSYIRFLLQQQSNIIRDWGRIFK